MKDYKRSIVPVSEQQAAVAAATGYEKRKRPLEMRHHKAVFVKYLLPPFLSRALASCLSSISHYRKTQSWGM